MSWQKRIAGMVEFVTDIVMGDDGTTTSNASSEDDQLTSQAGWHFGFYSRPKDGARGVVLKADGQGNTSFLLAWRDKQYELTLEKGEVGIKNAFDATILLNEDGEIIMNAGTAKVARVGDKIEAHLHAAGALMCPNTGTGFAVAVTGSTASHTGVAIAEGADKVKA